MSRISIEIKKYYIYTSCICVFRVVFWGDQGTRKVERVNLDGMGRQTVVQDGLVWPNQLAFSYEHRSVPIYFINVFLAETGLK